MALPGLTFALCGKNEPSPICWRPLSIPSILHTNPFKSPCRVDRAPPGVKALHVITRLWGQQDSLAVPFGDKEIGPEKFYGPKLSVDPVGSKAENKD